jgi:hypothetical protein
MLCLAACTSGQVGGYSIVSVDPATSGKLQFAVGWTTTYPSVIEQNEVGYGLNLVETLRQSNGRSAALTDSVELSVPAALGSQLPPLPLTGGMGLQLPSSVAAFGAGINSGSFYNASDLTTSGDFLPTVGTGGPPAFPPPPSAASLTQQFSEGYYATFPLGPLPGSDMIGIGLAAALAAYAGQYTLNVSLPTGQTSVQVLSARATLARKPLPLYLPPAVVADGNGGALVTITVPAGITETDVTIVGVACQTQTAAAGATAAPVLTRNEVYTLVSHVAGPGTDRLSLPDFVTPAGGLGTYQSLCSAAEYAVTGGGYKAYAAGFDYPAFESLYPQNFSQTPVLLGSAGQTDISISPASSFLTP